MTKTRATDVIHLLLFFIVVRKYFNTKNISSGPAVNENILLKNFIEKVLFVHENFLCT